MAYPSNVVHLATECSNKSHSAAFPQELPEWFIKLFTKPEDTVLDPFLGSGTTAFVAQRMQRNVIGIEIQPEYFRLVSKEMQSLYSTPELFDPETTNGSPKPKRRNAVRRAEHQPVPSEAN